MGQERRAEIAEALPVKLVRPSEALAVCLVEQTQAGLDSLPHLLLAAVFLVSQAMGLRRGEAASLGRLYQRALAVSMAMMAEIETVHRKNIDPTANQALS